MTTSSHPKAGTTIEAGEMAEHLKKILSMADRVEETFVLVTSPVSLNGTLTPGKAFIQGYEVGESGDAAENLTFTSASTNHIFIDQAGVVTVNTSGTPPANSIKLYEVVTDGSGVTSETNVEASEVEFIANVITQALTILGDFAAESGVLSDAQPYLEFEDTSGETFRIWARSNKLQITNFDGSTVYTDDISDVFGGASFIDSSEKGAANGVAELDGGGTVPSAQLPAATEGAKGAVELADAAPPGLASASAKGVSTEAAREDHTHSHGDRSAEGGTQHNLNQSSGTISDAQHGNRGGGALHANATGGAAGFLSASDKSKLDALSSDDDYMFTAGSLETSDLDDQTRAGAFGWTNTAINSPVSSSYGIGLNVVSDGPEYNGSSNWIVQYGNPTGAQGIYWRQAINASPWTAWKRLSQDADSAGGDLTGTYPNPTIGSSKVTESKIATGAVTNAKLGADAVDSTKLADNAVGSEHIQADAVGSSEIAANAVGSSEIAASAVGESEIATNAVTNTKIANDAVTNSKLANMADDTVKARNGGAGDPEDIAIAADRVLGRDGSGDLGSVQVTDAAIKSGVSATPSASKIPKYDAGGRLESNDPGSALEVVNKQYLEANLPQTTQEDFDNNSIIHFTMEAAGKTYPGAGSDYHPQFTPQGVGSDGSLPVGVKVTYNCMMSFIRAAVSTQRLWFGGTGIFDMYFAGSTSSSFANEIYLNYRTQGSITSTNVSVATPPDTTPVRVKVEVTVNGTNSFNSSYRDATVKVWLDGTLELTQDVALFSSSAITATFGHNASEPQSLAMAPPFGEIEF